MKQRTILILLIISLVALFQPSKAQFSLGVNTGAIRTKFSGDPASGFGRFQPDPGFSAGARVDYRFSDAFALSVQPGISSLRSRYQVMNDSGTALLDSTRMNLTSFSLPLHAVVWSENGRFFVLAGVQLDYILNFETEVLISPFSSPPSSSYDVRDYNLFVQFGAGFIVPLGKPYLSFELRYSQGVLDLNSDLVQTSSYLQRTKLTNLSFVIGLQVPLGAYSEKYQVKQKNR